ncbi:MAG: glycerol-3-phosphate 1-O-acyltransferase PlsY [Erysipelotrichaceae bacterium]|nr:glycerol-3-phosphate 1-O-acyltransferase PlsY [Erysipelotrichaceae bacterium]
MTNYLIYLLIGYLIGSIPFALVIGLVFYKKDIRNYGSGNLGGSNAGRVLGKKAGFAVIALDVLKAIIPVLIVAVFVDYDLAIATGLGAAIGHCYPLYAHFKGGKAVATSFGYVGAITVFDPKQFILLLIVPLIILYLVVKTTKYVSVGSMVSFGMVMILSYFVQSNLTLSISFTFLWLFIIYRHIPNIKKLRNHTETKVTW